MATKDILSRALVHVRERPSSRDLNKLQDYILTSLRWIQRGALGVSRAADPSTSMFDNVGDLPPNGFFGSGFLVIPGSSAFTVRILSGYGLAEFGPATATDIDGAQGADWQSAGGPGVNPLVLSASQVLTVPGAEAIGSSRIDIIEVRSDYLAGAPATVGIFNPASSVFDPTVKNKQLHWDLSGRTGTVNAPAASTAPISYVKGVSVVGAISAATEPAATFGYTKIGRINISGAIGAVTQSLIADLRPLARASGMISGGASITFPGKVGGIASPLNKVKSVALPPGVTLKVAFYNPTPPATGTSYTVYCLLVGANLHPATVGDNNEVGSAVMSSMDSAGNNRCCRIDVPTAITVDASFQGRYDGTNADMTNLTPTEVIPIGTRAITFSFNVTSPNASALANTEDIQIHFDIGQG